ncbi:MAG TPA: MBL fold metallo-hydrolase [Gemmatimonadaceae bacterium]|nr:MBL fold metallo-hydrolase [Gemmatimonadaceae bacterium]
MHHERLTTDNGSASGAQPITADLAYVRAAIVNVFLYGPPGAGDRGWVLIDAGVAGSAGRIAAAAAARFGPGSRPAAIVLTHGHFDHVGGLEELAARWDAPVYAHELELPYVTGRSAYPPPDPTVGGGAMAALSRFYPRGPIDLGERVRSLPADGAVPGMPGWTWLHTPGHTAGHVSLFGGRDRLLVAGDAVVTTKQESVFAVVTQRPALHGPPMYYTSDWNAAERSVRELAGLEPEILVSGHGRPLRGEEMRWALHALVEDFWRVAVPSHGRYVHQAAVADETGVISLPPAVPDRLPKVLLGVGAAVALGLGVRAMRRRHAPDDGAARVG